MSPSSADELRSFTPTGDETLDVERLAQITGALRAKDAVKDLVPDLLAVFERFPEALLGSPGPVVHCIETVPMDEFIPHLADSLSRSPTTMTHWMATRCLRSNPTEGQASLLMTALATIANNNSSSDELKEAVTETLERYGS